MTVVKVVWVTADGPVLVGEPDAVALGEPVGIVPKVGVCHWSQLVVPTCGCIVTPHKCGRICASIDCLLTPNCPQISDLVLICGEDVAGIDNIAFRTIGVN